MLAFYNSFLKIKLICDQENMLILNIYRSSRPEVFCRKGVLRNFTKLTGKHLCQSPFLKKVAGLWPATLFKKGLSLRCFPVNFAIVIRCSRLRIWVDYFIYFKFTPVFF